MFNILECLFGIKGHAALDRNPGLGCNSLLLQLISCDLLFFSACACPIDSSTHYLTFCNQALLPNSYPIGCVLGRRAVFNICKMAFGMTRPTRKPKTYHMSGGHTHLYAILTWYLQYQCHNWEIGNVFYTKFANRKKNRNF